jgi:hypothetical protein
LFILEIFEVRKRRIHIIFPSSEINIREWSTVYVHCTVVQCISIRPISAQCKFAILHRCQSNFGWRRQMLLRQQMVLYSAEAKKSQNKT